MPSVSGRAPAPAVVVNNTITNTQNNGAAETAPPPSAEGHPGLIAKGDSEDVVQAVLGAPSIVGSCGRDTTGWWYGTAYCVGFSASVVDYQYNVPPSKLYLPSW